MGELVSFLVGDLSLGWFLLKDDCRQSGWWVVLWVGGQTLGWCGGCVVGLVGGVVGDFWTR